MREIVRRRAALELRNGGRGGGVTDTSTYLLFSSYCYKCCRGVGVGVTYTTYLIICSVPTATIVQMLLAFFTERISPRDCGLPSKVLPVGLHLQASQP